MGRRKPQNKPVQPPAEKPADPITVTLDPSEMPVHNEHSEADLKKVFKSEYQKHQAAFESKAEKLQKKKSRPADTDFQKHSKFDKFK